MRRAIGGWGRPFSAERAGVAKPGGSVRVGRPRSDLPGSGAPACTPPCPPGVASPSARSLTLFATKPCGVGGAAHGGAAMFESLPGALHPHPPPGSRSLQEGLLGAVRATDAGAHHAGRPRHLLHRVLPDRAPGEWRGGPRGGTGAGRGLLVRRRPLPGLTLRPTLWPTQIVVSLVNGRPGAMNFSYSPLLRDFTKATNIRLRFLRTNTLLGHLMGKALRDPTVTRRVSHRLVGTGRRAGLGGARRSPAAGAVLLQHQGHQHRRPLCVPRPRGRVRCPGPRRPLPVRPRPLPVLIPFPAQGRPGPGPSQLPLLSRRSQDPGRGSQGPNWLACPFWRVLGASLGAPHVYSAASGSGRVFCCSGL